MWTSLRPRSIYDVFAVIGCFAALTTGSAYAVDTVFSEDIVDGEVKNVDIGNNQVTAAKIFPGSVTNSDIAGDAVDGSKILDSTIGAADLAFSSVASAELATNAVTASEIADGAIDSGEIIDNSLGAADLDTSSVGNLELAAGAVTNAKIGGSAVDSGKVANNTLRAFDLAGGESNGAIDVPAGFVASGRCRDDSVNVPNAKQGDAVIFSINGTAPAGILIYGVRVLSDGIVIVKVCNFTGVPMAAITDLPVSVVTITI